MDNYEDFKEKDFLSNINYGLIVVDKDENKRFENNGETILFHHFVGYIEKPGEADINLLYEELKKDPEFKIDNLDDLTIIDAPDYVIKHFKEINEK